VEIPLIDVAGDEDVERLRLADQRRAIGGEFDDPALIDFERGLEDVFLLVGEAIEMLDATFVFEDRRPDALGVLALIIEQLLRIGVLHRDRT
jgi:hypothetical protein